MSDDRELLEKAAKAVGFEYRCWSDDAAGTVGLIAMLPTGDRAWNPLTNDGEALRLAVRLGIKIELHPAWVYARAVIRGLEYLRIEEGWAHGGNPCAATRRAIVRAAASLAPKETQ